MSDRELAAAEIVDRYVKWAVAGGFIPVPMVDIAAVTAVQLRMVGQLAKLYEIPFKENAAKSIITALLGGVIPHGLTVGALGSLIKGIPVIGQVAGVVTMPVLSGAATYAVGKVFIQHFASGGTFLDLDPDKVKEHFQQEFEKAKAAEEAGTAAGNSGKAAKAAS